MKTEKDGYVVYTKIEAKNCEKILIFVAEFKSPEEAEDFKATGNRDFKLRLLVGIAFHHIHYQYEEKDKLIIKPKNGDEEFHYSEMVSLQSLLEHKNISQKGFDAFAGAINSCVKKINERHQHGD